MDYQTELKNFLDTDGKLKAYPSKPKQRLIALSYIVTKLDPAKKYKEIELNFALKALNSFGDHALLRRELIDNKFMTRTLDGSQYTVSEVQPKIEE